MKRTIRSRLTAVETEMAGQQQPGDWDQEHQDLDPDERMALLIRLVLVGMFDFYIIPVDVPPDPLDPHEREMYDVVRDAFPSPDLFPPDETPTRRSLYNALKTLDAAYTFVIRGGTAEPSPGIESTDDEGG